MEVLLKMCMQFLVILISTSGVDALLQCTPAELGSSHTLRCKAEAASLAKENLLWAIKDHQGSEPKIIATCDEHHCAVTDSSLYSAHLNVMSTGVSSSLTLNRVTNDMVMTFECWYWDSDVEKIVNKTCDLNVYANPMTSYCRDPEISKDGLKMRVRCVTKKVFPGAECSFVRQRIDQSTNQGVTVYDGSPGEDGEIIYEITETPDSGILFLTSECSLTTPVPEAGIYSFLVRVRIVSDYYNEMVGAISTRPITVSKKSENIISWSKGGLGIGVSLTLMVLFGIALAATICVKRRTRLKQEQVAKERNSRGELQEEIQLAEAPLMGHPNAEMASDRSGNRNSRANSVEEDARDVANGSNDEPSYANTKKDDDTPDSSNIYDSIKSYDISDGREEEPLVFRVEIHEPPQRLDSPPSLQVHDVNERPLPHMQHDLRHPDFLTSNEPPLPPLTPPPQRYANVTLSESLHLVQNRNSDLRLSQTQLHSQRHRATNDTEEPEEENNERNESPFYFEIPEEELCTSCCSPPKRHKYLEQIRLQEPSGHQTQVVQDQNSVLQVSQMNDTNLYNGGNQHRDDDVPSYLELLADTDSGNIQNEMSYQSNSRYDMNQRSFSHIESLESPEHHYDAIDNRRGGQRTQRGNMVQDKCHVI